MLLIKYVTVSFPFLIMFLFLIIYWLYLTCWRNVFKSFLCFLFSKKVEVGSRRINCLIQVSLQSTFNKQHSYYIAFAVSSLNTFIIASHLNNSSLNGSSVAVSLSNSPFLEVCLQKRWIGWIFLFASIMVQICHARKPVLLSTVLLRGLSYKFSLALFWNPL